MEIVRVDLGARSYEIMVGKGLMGQIGELISNLSLGTNCALITHEGIFELFGDRILDSLRQRRLRVYPIFVPEGEMSKNLEWTQRIYQVMLDSGLDRGSFVIALGGGVVGDLAGFVAGTYMRGIDFIQVPTTLLAQVDASIGGKTGVNLPAGKNLVGIFHQPRLVVIDVNALERLNSDEFESGMAEVIKYGVIKDEGLFNFLESNVKRILAREPEALEHIIYRSCSVKAGVVSSDERESGLRAILNYGHTIGHALESSTNYRQYKHGEAVSIGMACAAWIAQQQGFLKDDDFRKQIEILKLYGLPIFYKKPSPRKVYPYLWSDKKKRQGTLSFILPKKTGEVFVSRNVSQDLIKEALKRFHR
jgi:3-dehydroquinate synthase